ncbi:lysophospholipid transporter LplT [Paenibacillus hamazuiensis]|uniref:lysophospholipid transporter LplT n=1 Tax=Paenibacillus hamazuiensis TaxID=2936508 RepID=UPI00200E78F4|nr:lysophospholipid transporter LplT [Paenibacillus hamazuiensis]
MNRMNANPGTTDIRSLRALMFTQFLSAFADNMILFITLAIIKQQSYPDFYIGVVQGAFLFAYVVLAPFVGAFADKNAKSGVLLTGNAVKGLGILLLLAGVDPALSYAVVGIGAAVYSPAKYGILPELAGNEDALLKANAKIEGYTILAILAGSVCGGFLAKSSLVLALAACLALYAVSLGLTFLIPRKAGNPDIRYGKDALRFFGDMAKLFRSPKTCFSLVGTGSFWMSSAVLRLAVIAWIPLYLGIDSLDQISMLVAVTGVGIMAGALATPALVPVRKFYNACLYGLLMVGIIALFPLISNVYMAVALLLAVGFAGGVFIVPMNAVLQDEGHHMVGAGKTIAVQNFVENALMLIGVGLYTQVSGMKVEINYSILGVGFVLALFVIFLLMQKKRFTGAA